MTLIKTLGTEPEPPGEKTHNRVISTTSGNTEGLAPLPRLQAAWSQPPGTATLLCLCHAAWLQGLIPGFPHFQLLAPSSLPFAGHFWLFLGPSTPTARPHPSALHHTPSFRFPPTSLHSPFSNSHPSLPSSFYSSSPGGVSKAGRCF